jgi:hypothetical protein
MSKNALPVAPVQNIVHTPGPWGVEQTTVSNWIGRMRADGSKVEYIVAHTDRDSLRDDVLVRNDANARLIAAAPELLEACKAGLKACEASGFLGPVEMMQRAISKAESVV